MGGVIAAVANVIAIWLSEGPMDSGFGYFLTAELVIITAMAGYLSLPCSVSVLLLLLFEVASWFIVKIDPTCRFLLTIIFILTFDILLVV